MPPAIMSAAHVFSTRPPQAAASNSGVLRTFYLYSLPLKTPYHHFRPVLLTQPTPMPQKYLVVKIF